MATLAVIDLGTNTFHLLIIESSENLRFQEIYRERKFINLAEKGIEKISDSAMKRAKAAILKFRDVLDLFSIDQLKILGTEALRKASNGSILVTEVYNLLGNPVEIIGGIREAELIFKGVGLAVDLPANNHLIMDIGGGSVEFIISIKGKSVWSQSFPLGVAVLYRIFHQQDPISKQEIDSLRSYLFEFLSPLLLECKRYDLQFLTGASGSFEVIANMLGSLSQNTHFLEIEVELFYPIYQQVIKSSIGERLQLNGIPAERAEMIVVAMYLIYFIIKHTQIKKICISDYAIKEGAISEMLSNI